MDSTLLADVFVALVTMLCVWLVLYGAWLCLANFRRTRRKAKEDQAAVDAVVREPRRRAGAGSGSR
jgi:hypothetical protein